MYWIALQPSSDATCSGDVLVDAHTALAWWALQFTPLVARVQDALLLEVSGSERLFGGRAALVDHIYMKKKPVAPVEYAHGATSLIALGRLWSDSKNLFPDALPVHNLLAARPWLPTLTRLGCTTWGQLRALPRSGLVRRFGAELVDALDRAYGMQPELYPWLKMPESFDASLELSASVELAPALLFAARRLLAQLQVWLRARQHGVLALELLWELDARRSNALQVDAHHRGGSFGQLLLCTAQPTQDMQHLQCLLAEQLARVTLPAPVLQLRLRSVQTQPMPGESRSLLPQDLRAGDELHQLLERLSARLGPQQVQRATLAADHRPERMQRWHAATENAMKSGAAYAILSGAAARNGFQLASPCGLYPTWLLAEPRRLLVQHDMVQYQGSLDLLAGPQRLESGWLEGHADCALRDYFVARSPGAGLVWVFRERLKTVGEGRAPLWYLHGLFA